MSIIQILKEATDPEQTSPRYREKIAAADPYWKALIKAFDREWVDAFAAADGEAWEQEVDDAYERGFLNATQLWLEVFSRLRSA